MRSVIKGLAGSLFLIAAGPAALVAAELQFTLTAPAYRVLTEQDGSHQISMAGYAASGIPGYPALPTRASI